MENTTVKPEQMQEESRRHFMIFGTLIVLTVVNFFISRLHLPTAIMIISVLSVAIVQGTLVLCFFMHLISEKKLIYLFLFFTIGTVIGLFLLPLANHFDHITGTYDVP